MKLKCRFISAFCTSVMLKSRMYSERYSTFERTTAAPKEINTEYECLTVFVAAFGLKVRGARFAYLLAVD